MSKIRIEEETGTAKGAAHPNNGYWAGTFTAPLSNTRLDQWFAWPMPTIRPMIRIPRLTTLLVVTGGPLLYVVVETAGGWRS